MKQMMILLVVTIVMISCRVHKEVARVKYVDLPEEYLQISSGDTIMVGMEKDTMKIGFYFAKNGKLGNEYLYVVK